MAREDGDRLRAAFDRLGAGLSPALEEIWHDWARPLHNYAFALTGSQEEADDIVGDLMATLASQGRRLRRVKEPKAYLFAAVRNRSLTRLKRSRRSGGGRMQGSGLRGGDGEAGGSPEPAGREAEPLADGLAVREAVLALPPDQREVVVLHIWGGLTFEEAGRVAGVSANTAASRYRYALDKLRKVMADEPHRR